MPGMKARKIKPMQSKFNTLVERTYNSITHAPHYFDNAKEYNSARPAMQQVLKRRMMKK